MSNMTGRIIDQIRASKLPSNMMQFAARGALQVPPAENIEILVHLARHNKVFGDLARMTLAGWDEKASRAAASDPQTSAEVLDYFISPDNLRPRLLPALLENPSVPEGKLVKLALSASRETIDIMLKSPRVRSLSSVLDALSSSPYLKPQEVEELKKLVHAQTTAAAAVAPENNEPAASAESAGEKPAEAAGSEAGEQWTDDDGTIAAYINDHLHDIEAEGEKPFQAIGGVVELLGEDYFPVLDVVDAPAPDPSGPATAAKPAPKAIAPKKAHADPTRENALQKISHLDVKGRIQLALKGNKEERSLLIRDGTKVVAFAVLEAPKLTDGEVEKFASQKNVLEAVLRQIPLKRRFMKNYIVVRNLVANPRTPLDLGLGLMKNLLIADLKNLSGNKEVSETIRKLAMKMYKQKLDAANKK
ncbi:MAG TPA: hypothetical protein VFL34_18120 [Candidatus Sulfotelmatobacter sp.]|nr:hypothetical protein [Candidatus Sulfotelmatobacter sp.]